MNKRNIVKLDDWGNKSFLERLFSYLLMYSIIQVFWFWIITSSKIEIVETSILAYPILLLPILIPTLIERRIQKDRKMMGLPLYSNVFNEVEQLNADYEVKLEETAKKNYNKDNNNNIDKSDLSYWFDLKEKGAISDDEYEIKKKELM